MGKKIVTFGEVLLRLTPPNCLRIRQADSLIVKYGGSEANVAASLANYGLNVEFVTRLPQNEVAEACMGALRAIGIGTRHIIRGGDRLGIYFLEDGASMRASRVVYDRAGSAFSTIRPGMVDWERVFSDADWFHWSGIVPASSPEAAEVCMEAIEVADRMGLTISCDLNYRKNLWKYGKTALEVMSAMVAKSDVIFGAMPEYKYTLGVEDVPFTAMDAHYKLDEDAFLKECRLIESKYPHCRKMFIELRNSLSVNHDILAAVLYSEGTLKVAPVYDIDHVVDKVGVGDAFVGGMIYGLVAYPDNDRKALDFALAASALKNTVYGDFNQVTVEEVENLMNGNTSGRVSR